MADAPSHPRARVPHRGGVVAMAFVLTALCDALPLCAPGANGSWALAAKDGHVRATRWRPEPPCRWRIDTRHDFLSRFGGTKILIAGDSVSRMFYYELLLWLHGCHDSAEELEGEPSVDAEKCLLYASRRYDREPVTFVVSPKVSATASAASGVALTFRWVTHTFRFFEGLDDANAFDVAKQLRDDPRRFDVFLINAGFWHVRHPAYDSHIAGPFNGAAEQSAELIRALLALQNSSGVDVRRRVFWRSTTRVESPEGSFNTASMEAMNAGASPAGSAWRDGVGSAAAWCCASLKAVVPLCTAPPYGPPPRCRSRAPAVDVSWLPRRRRGSLYARPARRSGAAGA
jgi:hypothetical protein